MGTMGQVQEYEQDYKLKRQEQDQNRDLKRSGSIGSDPPYSVRQRLSLKFVPKFNIMKNDLLMATSAKSMIALGKSDPMALFPELKVAIKYLLFSNQSFDKRT